MSNKLFIVGDIDGKTYRFSILRCPDHNYLDKCKEMHAHCEYPSEMHDECTLVGKKLTNTHIEKGLI